MIGKISTMQISSFKHQDSSSFIGSPNASATRADEQPIGEIVNQEGFRGDVETNGVEEVLLVGKEDSYEHSYVQRKEVALVNSKNSKKDKDNMDNLVPEASQIVVTNKDQFFGFDQCRDVKDKEARESDEDITITEESKKSSVVSSNLGKDDSNSHGSLCNGLKVMKMKSLVGRPRKKAKSFRNPFDFGCGLKKNINKKFKCKSKSYPRGGKIQFTPMPLESIHEEEINNPVLVANEILQIVENLGLELVGEKDRAIVEIASQVEQGEL